MYFDQMQVGMRLYWPSCQTRSHRSNRSRNKGFPDSDVFHLCVYCCDLSDWKDDKTSTTSIDVDKNHISCGCTRRIEQSVSSYEVFVPAAAVLNWVEGLELDFLDLFRLGSLGSLFGLEFHPISFRQ